MKTKLFLSKKRINPNLTHLKQRNQDFRPTRQTFVAAECRVFGRCECFNYNPQIKKSIFSN